jgi:putative transposase
MGAICVEKDDPTLGPPLRRNPSDFSWIQAMGYSKGCHTTFHHSYHIVWAPKYRFKVLHGEVRLRVREIIRQVCVEMGVTIINGALSRDHVHMFVEIPPHVWVSDFVRRAKGRSSRKIQEEFEHIRECYWGQRFWGRGNFSTTSGNITDEIIMGYLDRHIRKDGFSPSA